MPDHRPRSAASLALALAVASTVATPAEGARKTRKVSGPSVVGSDVVVPLNNRPRISPDGEWIVWVQDAEVNNAHAVWAARRWGGERKRLSGVLPPGNEVFFVEISPDSRRVVYTAEQETAGRYDLYTVPLLGTAADGVKLTPGPVSAFNVRFSADGSRIVFNTLAPGAHTLYSAPVDGSAAATGLDGPFGGAGMTDGFRLAGGRVVFERRDTPGAPREVWSVPIAGPATAKVQLTDFANELGTTSAALLEVSPDSTRVAFVASDGGPAPELWVANVAGASGSAIKLVTATVPNGGVLPSSPEWTPDGSRIVFRGDLDVVDQEELFSVPADGTGSTVKLNTALIAAGDVGNFPAISPDGSLVVYLADWAVDGRLEVFSVPVGGPSAASVRLNRTLDAGESLLGAGIIDDLVFYSVAAGATFRELRGNHQEGPASAEWPVLVANTELRGPGGILGDRAVLVGDPVTPGSFDLYSVPSDGTSSPTGLHSPFWNGVVHGQSTAWSPDQRDVFFLASVSDGPLHLWSTRVDGSQLTPTRLSVTPSGSGGVIDGAGLEVSRDGHAILFEADAEVTGREELYISDSLIFAADFDEEGDLSEWQP